MCDLPATSASADLTFPICVHQGQYIEVKLTHSREGRNKASIYQAPFIHLTLTLIHVHILFHLIIVMLSVECCSSHLQWGTLRSERRSQLLNFTQTSASQKEDFNSKQEVLIPLSVTVALWRHSTGSFWFRVGMCHR